MAIKRGNPNIRRVHAGNYIQEQAQRRLDEAVKPAQQKGLNALGVDNHTILLYLKQMSTTVCSCREVQQDIVEMDVRDESPVQIAGIGQETGTEINIDWSRPLFGESGEVVTDIEDMSGANDYDFVDDAQQPTAVNHVIESSPDCGICYRSGFVPGFEQYGQVRYVLTTHNMVNENAYNIDRTEQPHMFHKLAATGWIEFEIKVPKYFKSVKYSVRNNHDLLNEKLFIGNQPLCLDDLKAFAGQTLPIRVRAETFTHAVVVFDLGSDPIVANIAQLSKLTDWTQFETIGNLGVILPMTIKELPVGSFIIVPDKYIGLKVTDVQYLRTSKNHNLDWNVTTRVAQPMESWKSIHKSFQLF